MAISPTQINIDAEIKEQATTLFNELGLDMSTAVNLFLHQCILRGGLPFNVETPRHSQRTLDAINEARYLSRNPNVKGYTSMDELEEALEKN